MSAVEISRSAATLTHRMSSRQEEKERRRQERLEREQAEQASVSKRKRLQFVLAGGAAVVIVVVGVVLAAGSLGSGKSSGAVGQPTTPKGSKVAIPAAAQADLTKAATAASCKVVNAPIEGNTHLDKNFVASDYKTNPPTSGNHNPVWYQDGIYAPGDVPKLGMVVHPLEHGRIEIQYKPGTASHTVAQLTTLTNSLSGGYHILMFQNTTAMPFQVAAAAWGHYIGCPTMNDHVFDAIRDFYTAHVDKGPEIIP
jgi:hypothetical protein